VQEPELAGQCLVFQGGREATGIEVFQREQELPLLEVELHVMFAGVVALEGIDVLGPGAEAVH